MEICLTIQTWGFNKRLCWMLSSALQQEPDKGLPVPEVSVNLAYIKNTGVEEVIDVFKSKGMKISSVVFNDYEDGFSRRGLVRNKQIKDCSADWVLFADSDMVYAPSFFSMLGEGLNTTYKDNPKCLYLPRYSNEEPEAEALVNAPDIKYPCIIPDTYLKASKMNLRGCRNVGAGYCQIASMEQLRKNHKGLYQPEGMVLDGPIGTSLKNRSDRNFRVTLGAEALHIPGLPIQIHLQHPRQKNDYPK